MICALRILLILFFVWLFFLLIATMYILLIGTMNYWKKKKNPIHFVNWNNIHF